MKAENQNLTPQRQALPDAAAHMFTSDLEKFKSQETFAHAYSVKVGCPGETSVELFTLQLLQEICHPYVEGCRLALEYLQDSEATISDLSLVLASLLRLRDSPVQAGLEARLLGNLLARIHGDGGDHVLEHGLEKAAADAEDMVATWQNLVTAVRGDLGIAEFLPEAERGALEKMYQAMARKLYAKHREGTAGFETASAEHLSSLLRRHVTKGDPVDVANFCAFLLFNGQRIAPAPAKNAWDEIFGDGLGPFKSGGLVPGAEIPDMPLQFETLPLPGETISLDLLQRQPPKGWGVYRVPGSTEILISKPNGDGVCVTPDSDALLYELASAMLPPAGSDQSNF